MKKGIKVLVTGGAGYVGAPLTKLLIENKFKVTLLDTNPKGFKNSKNLKVIKGSIQNEKIVKDAVKNQDVIYHLALPFYKDTKKFIASNMHGTYNLLYHGRPKQFILASSQAVYGSKKHTIKETDFCDPLSLPIGPHKYYGLVKLKTERMCINWCLANKIPFTIFRISGAFGGKSSHIPTYPNFKKGGNFIEVNDIARAFLLTTLNKKAFNKTYNLSAFYVKSKKIPKLDTSKIRQELKFKLNLTSFKY